MSTIITGIFRYFLRENRKNPRKLINNPIFRAVFPKKQRNTNVFHPDANYGGLNTILQGRDMPHPCNKII
jgi:hypothetical protein